MRFPPLALVALAWASSGSVWAQVPSAAATIKAHSRLVTITDGLHVKRDYWYVMPERNPDVYYVEIPRHPHTVTFTTDVESVSFQTTYGSRHDFVIELADGKKAHTQIRAEYRNLLQYRRTRAGNAGSSHTIPFSLGDNDKSTSRDASTTAPSLTYKWTSAPAAASSTATRWRRSACTSTGRSGCETATATTRCLRAARTGWKSPGWSGDAVPFAAAGNMTRREDAIVGNALFQDQALEIDYDRGILTIHDAPPSLPAGWTPEDMLLDGVVPFVRAALVVGDDVRHGWFMLDTGAYTSILNSDCLGPSSKLVGELRQLLGGRRRGPAVIIAGRTFADINYSLGRYDGNRAALGLLGNDVLKRFNLLVDNRSGTAYFRPNGRVADLFRNPEYYVVRVVLLAAGAGATAAAWSGRRRWRRAD